MFRGVEQWGMGYLQSMLRRPRGVTGTRHLLFCVADHFEPFRGGADADAVAARATVRDWCARYLEVTAPFRDADGCRPKHTFFYPQEDYDRECVDALRGVFDAGGGEVEVHIHHRGDTAESLAEKLAAFRDRLAHDHGLLGRRDGVPTYGFVHGNWALCNSRPDGDWCGVDQELRVLRDTHCYADFTFPSAPSPTQPKTVNAVYRARDGLAGPRGHDRGVPVRSGGDGDTADALMIVQGALALNWRRRKAGLFPRLENSEISGVNPLTPERIDLCVRQQVHVLGRPEWVIVKVHTHGCLEANMPSVVGEAFAATHRHLADRYNDGTAWQLHYVTARELTNMILAAEGNRAGPPGAWRDTPILAPPVCQGES